VLRRCPSLVLHALLTACIPSPAPTPAPPPQASVAAVWPTPADRLWQGVRFPVLHHYAPQLEMWRPLPDITVNTPAPLTPQAVLEYVIPQAADWMPDIPFTPESNVLLLTIGLQESRFRHRRQIRGPARGFWQFERFGGTLGVLTHKSTRRTAHALAQARLGDTRAERVNEALAEDDVLACGFARLLLWTDPKPLPKLGDSEGAWQYYLRNWRPGKPHRHTWDALYDQALKLLTEDV